MSKIAYVRTAGSFTIHVSISTGKYLGADMHDVTVCGTNIRIGLWTEAPRPTEIGAESNLSRCKRCDRKRIEGVPAFDYEEELAGRASIHDPLLTECADCGDEAEYPVTVDGKRYHEDCAPEPTKEA